MGVFLSRPRPWFDIDNDEFFAVEGAVKQRNVYSVSIIRGN